LFHKNQNSIIKGASLAEVITMANHKGWVGK